MYNAALPARTLPLAGQAGYGLVGSVSGAAMLAGSALAVLLPAPKRRARVICGTLLLSMSTENFLLALGRSPLPWCVGAVLGWIGIPLMNANLDALLRTSLPLEMQAASTPRATPCSSSRSRWGTCWAARWWTR